MQPRGCSFDWELRNSSDIRQDTDGMGMLAAETTVVVMVQLELDRVELG